MTADGADLEPATRPAPEWVTLLASGGASVYLFDARDTAAADHLQAVLEVAYPAAGAIRQTIAADRWPEVREALAAEGVEIVDRTVTADEAGPVAVWVKRDALVSRADRTTTDDEGKGQG